MIGPADRLGSRFGPVQVYLMKSRICSITLWGSTLAWPHLHCIVRAQKHSLTIYEVGTYLLRLTCSSTIYGVIVLT